MTLFLRIEEGGHEEKCLYALIQKVKDPETGLFQSFCSLRQLVAFLESVCMPGHSFACLLIRLSLVWLSVCFLSKSLCDITLTSQCAEQKLYYCISCFWEQPNTPSIESRCPGSFALVMSQDRTEIEILNCWKRSGGAMERVTHV